MGQLTQNIIFFNDIAGVVLPGFRNFFYEAGTNTLQTVYSDKELITPIAQPVVTDASGVLQQIWLQPKSYRWVGEDANLVNKFDRDDINFAENVINTSSVFIFSTVSNMTLGILINGESIDLQDGQSAATQGSITEKDGLGSDYIIETTDPGGSIALNNGLFATELENFENADDVTAAILVHNDNASAHPNAINAKITTHDDLSLGAVHTTLMTGHNADSLSHSDIRTDISTNTTDISTNSDKADKALGSLGFMGGVCIMNNPAKPVIPGFTVPGGPTFSASDTTGGVGKVGVVISSATTFHTIQAMASTPGDIVTINAGEIGNDQTQLDFEITDSSGTLVDRLFNFIMGFDLPTPP